MVDIENTFDSNEPLAQILTDITGAETATLTEDDYAGVDNGDGTYTYEAVYTAQTGGDYTFTLTTAEDAAGNDGASGESDTASVSVVPDSGVARLTFDDADTSSGTALDVWGSNDGTLNGGVTTGASGQYNEAYSFDGADDEVTLPASIGSLDDTTDFSYHVWVYPTAFSGEQRIVNLRSNYSSVLATGRTGSSELSIYVSSDHAIQSLSTDTWYHVVVTHDASTDETTVYVDGSQAIQFTESMADGGNKNSISDSTNTHNGIIDDPRWYDTVLSGTEASNLHQTGSIGG